MRHVDFSQLETAKTVRFELNYFWVLFGTGFMVLLMISFASLMQYRLSSLLHEKDNLSAELESLRSSKSEQEKNEEIRRAVQKVLNRPIIWTGIVNKIARRVPHSIRLSELSGALDNGRALKMKGVAQTMSRIFELKANLESIPECAKIVLLNVAKIDDPLRQEGIGFDMECRIQ